MNLGEISSKRLEYHLTHQPATEQGSALLCSILYAPIAHLGIISCFLIVDKMKVPVARILSWP